MPDCFSFSPLSPFGASSVVVDLVSSGLHKIVIGGTSEGSRRLFRTERSKRTGTIRRGQPDLPLAPTPDIDSGVRYRNHPSFRQLKWRLGTGKPRGQDYASPLLGLRPCAGVPTRWPRLQFQSCDRQEY